MTPFVRACAVMLAMLTATSQPLAQEAPQWLLSGFASVVGGKVLSGQSDVSASYPYCTPPCYVADWANGGVYGTSLTLKPESRIGLQATYVFNPAWSATAQVTSRAVDASPRLEWAYLSYKFGNWDLQLGRKRIPLYFYSDFQDIGVAYPWISPPPDLYGWEATNYNGASLRYRGTLGGVGVSSSIFAGSESVNNARLYTLYETQPVDIEWTDLMGADLELNRDWWTWRFAYSQNNMREHYHGDGSVYEQAMKTYSVAFNADFGDWFYVSEFGEISRQFGAGVPTRFKVQSLMAGLGYRYGNWTPTLTLSRFHERDASPDYQADSWNTYGFTLRYDLTPLQAVKIQFNKTQDTAGTFTGNTSVVRVSYDVQF